MKWSYKNTRGERFFALDCPAVSVKKQTADYSIFFVKNLAIYASRVLNYGANNDLTLNCLKSSGAGLDAKNIAESGLGAVFKHNDWAWLSLNKINKIVADASVSEGTKEAIKALKNDAVNNGSVFVAIKSNKKCQKCGDLK